MGQDESKNCLGHTIETKSNWNDILDFDEMDAARLRADKEWKRINSELAGKEIIDIRKEHSETKKLQGSGLEDITKTLLLSEITTNKSKLGKLLDNMRLKTNELRKISKELTSDRKELEELALILLDTTLSYKYKISLNERKEWNK